MTFAVAGAFADAGNPITNTINGSIAKCGDPGGPSAAICASTPAAVTVYVRGQWNWLSHNKDCNLDRNGTGVGMIWNDPTEPGFTVAKGAISAGVGVASVTGGRNVIDEMVHPSDIGDDSPAGTGIGRAGQVFNDAGDDVSPSPLNYKDWRSGCGREPFVGDPFGSWGYDKNLGDGSGGDNALGGGRGYRHVYARRADVTTVCVNFYDVHGSNAGLQAPNGAKEIDVNGNGDNSIQTNAFNVLDGANCINFPFIQSTTPVTNVTVGSKIHDSATVGGAGATQQTTLTFHLFGPADPTCGGAAIFNSGPFTVTGNNSATSGDYDTTPPGGAGAGTYQWTVELRQGNTGTGALLDTSGCGKEPSVVKKAPAKLTTTASGPVTIGSAIHDTGHLTNGVSPTGTITFKAYAPKSDGTADGACGTLVFTSVVTVNGNNDYDSANFTPSGTAPQIAGSYNWTAEYSGDASNDKSSTACGETGETSLVKKSPTRTDTTEALKITEKIKVTLTATGTSTISATGPTRIRLFKGTCVTGSEDNGTTPLFDETHTLNNNAFDVTLDITSPGDFYWFVEYQGDANTDPSNDDCTETFSVHFPVI